MLNIVLLCISVCALIIAIIVNIHTWLTRTEEDYDYIFRQLLLLFFCAAVIILDAWFFPCACRSATSPSNCNYGRGYLFLLIVNFHCFGLP